MARPKFFYANINISTKEMVVNKETPSKLALSRLLSCIKSLSSKEKEYFTINALLLYRVVGSFVMVRGEGGGDLGAEQKSRPPWLTDVEKLKKHWLKLLKTVP